MRGYSGGVQRPEKHGSAKAVGPVWPCQAFILDCMVQRPDDAEISAEETALPVSPTAAEIGAEIREARTRSGLSMRDLAALIQTSQPFVSNVENGRIFPSLRTLSVIARALEVPVEELLPSTERLECREATTGMRPRREGEELARRLVGGEGTLNAFRMELRPGELEPRPFVHAGVDVLYTVRGSVELHREGVGPIRLRGGQSMHLDGDVPHRLGGGSEGGVVIVVSTDCSQHAEEVAR